MATAKTTQDKAEQHFLELLKGFDTAMLVTHGNNVGLHARPMGIAQVDSDGSIWFITGGDTAKVDEVRQDATALAVMMAGSKQLSVGGRTELSRDRAKIAEVWKETFRAWFKGKDDPNIVLMRLTPSEAEYWDNSGLQGLKFALKFAEAYISGKSMRNDEMNVDPNVHGKVSH